MWLAKFVQSAATLLLKNKHYFTESFIFPSPGDVSVAIAAPTAKRQTYPPACCHPKPHASLLPRSKMPLLPPMPQSLILAMAISPPASAVTLSHMHLCCPDPRCLCCLQCRNPSSWPWQSLLRPLPPFATIASRCTLTLVIASHCLPLLPPSMVGCCILPCSVIRCPLRCPLLPSLTLSLPAAAPSSF
jgi:hypothetical protein